MVARAEVRRVNFWQSIIFPNLSHRLIKLQLYKLQIPTIELELCFA